MEYTLDKYGYIEGELDEVLAEYHCSDCYCKWQTDKHQGNYIEVYHEDNGLIGNLNVGQAKLKDISAGKIANSVQDLLVDAGIAHFSWCGLRYR